MPIYEYKCESCSYVFEELQKISDAPLKKCPECQKETLRKQITAAGFKLKGSGLKDNRLTDFIRMIQASIPQKSLSSINSDTTIEIDKDRRINKLYTHTYLF